LRDFLAFVVVSSCYKYGLVVVVSHVGEGSVRLDEVGCVEGYAKFIL
jgi:hypothetical protein